ncbi:hypothetical protein N9F34_05670 [Alphaproteobacteria bacterium]|nr:hypothetical protein [Alphaproteobacteria bacterium]
MSSVIINEARDGLYIDSVALMRFSRTIAALEGVEEAVLMMGTPANRQIMAGARLLDTKGGRRGRRRSYHRDPSRRPRIRRTSARGSPGASGSTAVDRW